MAQQENPFVAMMNASEYPMAEFMRHQHLVLPELTVQDLAGKVVIVTGANIGIGFETAKALASMKPKKLILACRNAEKAQAALKEIRDTTGCADLEVWSLDLASFASVRAFAKRFLDTGLPLDILVSNAGVSNMNNWVTTDDGYEITLQVNHLSNVLLVSLLHPALKRAADVSKGANHFPRVQIVASDTHFWCKNPVASDPNPVSTLSKKPEQFELFGIYPSTKLLNILFAKAYAARCPDAITIYSSNPGYTESQLGAKDPTTGEPRETHANNFKKRTTYEGAKTIIECAINPNTAESGAYYSDMTQNKTRSDTLGDVGAQFASNVWTDTIALLKKEVPENPVYSW